MNKVKIKLEYNKAFLANEPIPKVTSGSRGVVSIEFDFSSEWKDFVKTAILYVDKYEDTSAVKLILDENNKIKEEDLPPDLIAQKCDLYIGVFGDKGEQRITSNVVCVPINEGVPTSGVNVEINQDLYNQIVQVMTETKQIAQSAEDKMADFEERANSGEFDGKDGVDGKDGLDGKDGYTPVKGTDYFTDAEIKQIEQNAADKVPLDDYVPTIRKIADRDLSKDLSYDDIGFIVSKALATGGSWYSILLPWLISQCGSKSQQDINTSGIAELKNGMSNYVPTSRAIAGIDLEDDITDTELGRGIVNVLVDDSVATLVLSQWATQLINNNSAVVSNTKARHTHDNKDFLDNLTEACVRPYWKLIRRIKITEAVATITITTDSDGNPFKFNRIKIIMPKLYLSGTANIFNYFKDCNDKIINFMASTSVQTDSKADWTAQIINNEYIYMEAIIRRGTDAASVTSLYRDNSAETDGIVTGIYITCGTNFTAGTEILIYGGYDE